MSFIIEDNHFTDDSYNIRTTRLSLLSANIDTYAQELGITQDMKKWAEDAHDIWADKLAVQSAEQGERHEASQTSRETDKSFRKSIPYSL